MTFATFSTKVTQN